VNSIYSYLKELNFMLRLSVVFLRGI